MFRVKMLNNKFFHKTGYAFKAGQAVQSVDISNLRV